MAKDKLVYKLSADSTEFNRALRDASKSLESFGKVHSKGLGRLKNLGTSAAKGIAAVGAAATTAAVALSVKATKAAATFERAIVSAGAKSAATGQQLKAMQEAAIGASSGAEFSAQQAAEAMGFLAAAGFDVEQQMAALPAVLNLASAGELELAESADLASNVLSQFGFDVAELGRVNDVLVKAANSANTSVHQLGEALSYAGPAAAGAGISLEETVAMIGKLSDAGLQADRAGTGLQQVMAQLGAAGKKLGVDLNGTRIANLGLAGSLRELEKAGLNAQNAGEFFTTRAKTSLQAILLQGIPAVEGLDKALQSAGGTAQEVADKKIDTLQGSINILTGNVENFLIVLGQKFAPAVKNMSDQFAAFSAELRNNDALLQRFANGIASLVSVAAGVTRAVGLATGAVIRLGGALSFNLKAGNKAADDLAKSIDEITGGMTDFAAQVKAGGSGLTTMEKQLISIDAQLRSGNLSIRERIKLEKELFETQNAITISNLRDQADQAEALERASTQELNRLNKVLEQRKALEALAARDGLNLAAIGSTAPLPADMDPRTREQVQQFRDIWFDVNHELDKTRNNLDGIERDLDGAYNAQERLKKLGVGVPDTLIPEAPKVGPSQLSRAKEAGESMGEEVANGFRGGFGTPEVLTAIALDTVAEKRGADMASSVLEGFNSVIEQDAKDYAFGQKMFASMTEGVEEMIAEQREVAERWRQVWDNVRERFVDAFSNSIGDAFLGALEGNVDSVRSAIKGLIKDIAMLAAKAAILNIFESASPGGAIPGALGFASGGYVSGPGTSTSDSIPARLSNGEYVMQASAVRAHGVGFMEMINSIRTPGGASPQRFASGGSASSGGGDQIKIINVVDSSEVEAIMAGPAGERVIFNVLSRKADQFRSILR